MIWNILARKLCISGSLFILCVPQMAWFASVQCILRRIWPLRILKSTGQDSGTASLGSCTLKKSKNIKNNCYFSGKYVADNKNPVLIHGNVLPFLRTDFEVGFSSSSVITQSYVWIPTSPSHKPQLGNFPMSHVQDQVIQMNENRQNSPSFLHLFQVPICLNKFFLQKGSTTLKTTERTKKKKKGFEFVL